MERERERESSRHLQTVRKLAACCQLHSPAMLRHWKLAVSKSLVDRYCNRRLLRIRLASASNLNLADNLLPPLIRVILEERLRALG